MIRMNINQTNHNNHTTFCKKQKFPSNNLAATSAFRKIQAGKTHDEVKLFDFHYKANEQFRKQHLSEFLTLAHHIIQEF